MVRRVADKEECPNSRVALAFPHHLRFEAPSVAEDSLGDRPMTIDDVMERMRSDSEARNKWVGVYIGILAVLLAVCSVGGGNAAKDATRANIEASNTWAFFQAKNIRRQNLRVAIDELEIRLTEPGLSPATREAMTKKVAEYKTTVQRLTSEPDTKEGLNELFTKGKALEVERDIALRKDPYFDWSQALLQIAIVLASVHLIIGSMPLLALSGGLGLVGILLMINGFTLAVQLPFLG
jgi:Domain of unknown function (DUF4337)